MKAIVREFHSRNCDTNHDTFDDSVQLLREVTMDRLHSRRTFVTGLGLAAVAGKRRALGANEILEIGCIGTGGRCRGLMRALAKIPGIRLAAVCDIWDEHREAG